MQSDIHINGFNNYFQSYAFSHVREAHLYLEAFIFSSKLVYIYSK